MLTFGYIGLTLFGKTYCQVCMIFVDIRYLSNTRFAGIFSWPTEVYVVIQLIV